MTRSYRMLAWAAAVATYLLIVLGAVVRITGSGLGCGNDWPVCHGHLFPSLSDMRTFIEWNHRLVAAIVTALVTVTAAATWWYRARAQAGQPVPSRAGYLALGLLVVQVLLGAVTVKLDLPAWTVVLHLGTAMLLLAVLLAAARGARAGQFSMTPLIAATLGFVTVLFGALTANLGAATACVGFPLCNGQVFPAGNYLQHIQWTHRLLAYGLFVYLLVWAWRSRRRGPTLLLGLVIIQVGIAAAMVLHGVPPGLQVGHAAAGAALWAGLVLVLFSNPLRPVA
jgi:heme A synthase